MARQLYHIHIVYTYKYYIYAFFTTIQSSYTPILPYVKIFKLVNSYKSDLNILDGGEGGGVDEVDPGPQPGGHRQLLRAVRDQLPLRVRVLILCTKFYGV